MRGLGGQKGNYAYTSARVRAKKSSLLTKDNYPKLLMMDISEIGRFMGETAYKTEMAELGSKHSGVNLIELGTSKSLARTYREILGFSTGDLHDMIAAYLERFDVWNIKTVLRGKFSGASQEEILEYLIPAGSLSEEYLNSLLVMDSVKEILEALKKKNFALPDDVIGQYEKTGTLAPVEDYLDKIYYTRLVEQVRPSNRPKGTFLSFLEREIDIVNLRSLLKLKQAGIAPDKIRTYMIEGGHDLKMNELSRLASIESFDQMVDELSKISFFDEIKEPIEKAKKTGSLTDVMLTLQKKLARESEKFSHLYPLSVLPVVDFIIRKKIEVDNIRIIARGKESGMDPEVIKSLLVM